MALCLTDGEVAARRKQDMAAKVVKTKQAAELLSSKDDGRCYQQGNICIKYLDRSPPEIGKPVKWKWP